MSLVRACVQGTMWTSFWKSGSFAEAFPGVSGSAYGHHMYGGKVSVSERQHPFPVSTSTWFPFCNSKPQRKMFAWKGWENRRFFWSIENGSCDQPNPKRSTSKWCYSTLFNNWCLSTDHNPTQPWHFSANGLTEVIPAGTFCSIYCRWLLSWCVNYNSKGDHEQRHIKNCQLSDLRSHFITTTRWTDEEERSRAEILARDADPRCNLA